MTALIIKVGTLDFYMYNKSLLLDGIEVIIEFSE